MALLDSLKYKLGLTYRPPGDERFYVEVGKSKLPVNPRYDEQCVGLDADSDRLITAEEQKYITAEVPFHINKERYIYETVAALTSQPLDSLKDYPTYEECTQRLQELEARFPGKARLESLGQSHEGREIWALHLGTSAENPAVVVTGLTHAREWPSLAIPLELATNLLETNDERLNRCSVIVVPMVNPDGYEYSRTEDSLWRKNRNPENAVDLNRNYFDPQFPLLYRPAGDKPESTRDDIGATDNPAYRQYRGKSGSSEPEVQALQRLTNGNPHVIASLENHCCGELLLYPEGGDHARYQAIGNKMKAALGGSYVVDGTSRLYPVSGAPNDVQDARGQIGMTMESCLSFQPTAAELAQTLPCAVEAHKIFIDEALLARSSTSAATA